MYKKHINNNRLISLVNKEKNIIILILSIIIYIYFRSGVIHSPVEDLDIPSGVGVDFISANKQFSKLISFYNYGGNGEIYSIIGTGTGSSLAKTREERQLLTNKKMLLGLQRVYVFGEEYASFGIKNLIDIEFKNRTINDTALLAVCKGKVEDIFSYKIPTYPSTADYLEGILEHSTAFNFFSNNYKMMDIYVRMDAEGRSVVLPYIQVKDKELKITGMALFKKDKMVKKIDIDEARVMNLLRENKVKGMLVLQDNLKEYISYYTQTKRKVRCEKKEDKYTFFIDLSLNGEIVENELFPDIHESAATMRKFESQMIEKVEKMSYDFIKKMQKDCKVDCLALGKVAAAKYGRHTGVDWDEVVSNSDIIVNVEVKVDNMGRGDYE
ncbi:Ger(x)C family spore germination protein [Clostridium sediminicola]|uniref:Ger(x)C family spore germination protein n=1 Tax=Clostridium sediminicola TaxID=3114879 RepID=UPI0031F1DD4E